MKTFVYKFEYTMEIDAENEEEAQKKLEEQVDGMDWEESQEFTNPDNWILQ